VLQTDSVALLPPIVTASIIESFATDQYSQHRSLPRKLTMVFSRLSIVIVDFESMNVERIFLSRISREGRWIARSVQPFCMVTTHLSAIFFVPVDPLLGLYCTVLVSLALAFLCLLACFACLLARAAALLGCSCFRPRLPFFACLLARACSLVACAWLASFPLLAFLLRRRVVASSSLASLLLLVLQCSQLEESVGSCRARVRAPSS
jgi:hypothetical protein